MQPLYTETYTFFVTAADGVRLWVDGQLIIDDFNDHAATQDSAAIALVGGQKYDIRLDYLDHADAPSLKLEWSRPGASAAGDSDHAAFAHDRRRLRIRL